MTFKEATIKAIEISMEVHPQHHVFVIYSAHVVKTTIYTHLNGWETGKDPDDITVISGYCENYPEQEMGPEELKQKIDHLLSLVYKNQKK